MKSKDSMLSFFRNKTSRPLSFREILSLSGTPPSGRRALRRLLRDMLKSGELVLTRKGLYGLADEMNLVTGYFEAHRDGYGFVISEKPGERDVFVPARWASGSMNNDRVIARIEKRDRRDGRIIRILERASSRITGKLDVASKGGTRSRRPLAAQTFYVKPKNKAYPFDVFIAPQDRGAARPGDTVVAEIINFPSDKRPPSGKIVKIIKKPLDPGSEVEAIIEEFNLPQRFPRTVHDEAKALSQPGPDEMKNRKDLRTLHAVTIDGERARDFDDAVSIKLAGHGYKLWVHIADVGFFVKWDSPLDMEARKRATSTYFPDRVLPMLPKELSEELCSLMPRVDRLAFTAEMDFDRNGKRTGARFYPSIINSNERMTYTSVRKILVDLDMHERQKYSYLLPDFELMNELCNALRERRLERGSLDFDLPEPEVILDLQGRPEAIIRSERNLAHMMIEEFMIAANEAVAEHLERMEVPSIYRIHEEPDSVKLEEIMKIAKTFTKTRKKAVYASDFSRLLIDAKGTPGEETINYMVLRSLKQARYSTRNAGHFGLASKCYTHFTSPIRRYPDLVVHRILREALAKKSIAEGRIKVLESILPDIAFQSSRMERLSGDAEAEVINAMRAWFMKDRLGEEFDCRVTGITPYGLKVRLKDFYIDGFIHVSFLTDDFYSYDEKTLTLSGRNTGRAFRIGKELRVRIDRIDMEEREIIFGLC